MAMTDSEIKRLAGMYIDVANKDRKFDEDVEDISRGVRKGLYNGLDAERLISFAEREYEDREGFRHGRWSL
jgi:hypothetical protein